MTKTFEEYMYEAGMKGVSDIAKTVLEFHSKHPIKELSDFAAQSVREDRESRWISVKTPPELTEQVYWYNDENERVPWEGKFERHVLAICSEKGIIKARYDGVQWVEIASFGSSSIVNIILWQPLPEKP